MVGFCGDLQTLFHNLFHVLYSSCGRGAAAAAAGFIYKTRVRSTAGRGFAVMRAGLGHARCALPRFWPIGRPPKRSADISSFSLATISPISPASKDHRQSVLVRQLDSLRLRHSPSWLHFDHVLGGKTMTLGHSRGPHGPRLAGVSIASEERVVRRIGCLKVSLPRPAGPARQVGRSRPLRSQRRSLRAPNPPTRNHSGDPDNKLKHHRR